MRRLLASTAGSCLPRRHRLIVDYFYLRAKFFTAAVSDLVAPHGEPAPVPPPRLRFRVHGDVARDSFLTVGRRWCADLRLALRTIGRDLEDFRSILDWGCGCGRVARHLLATGSGASLSGCDIDRELVEWCRANLPAAEFRTVPPVPPTPYRDAQFDLVYGISVLTHLDETMQHLWLAELRRIIKPGGIAALTVHGSRARRNLRDDALTIIERDGFYFDVLQTGRFKHDGLPDFYQTTYHSRKYVLKNWPRHLDVLAYLEGGRGRQQDIVVLGKALPAATPLP